MTALGDVVRGIVEHRDPQGARDPEAWFSKVLIFNKDSFAARHLN